MSATAPAATAPSPTTAPKGPVDRRLLAELPAVRASLAASVALGLVGTAALVVQALALARLLASAMPGAVATGRGAAFVWLGCGVALRALVALAGEPVARLGASAAKGELRRRLVSAAVGRAPARASRAPGDIAALAGRGLDALDVYLGRCLPDLVLAALAPLAMLVAVGVLDWLSACVLLVVAGLFPLFGALVGRSSASLARARWREVESLGRQVADVFEGLAVLRAFGRSAEQRERIRRASAALRDASLATLRVAFLSALVLDTLASIAVALVAVPLGLRLLHGSIGLPAALAVLVLAPEVLLPMRRASAEFHESTEGLAALAAALPLLEVRSPGAPGVRVTLPVDLPDASAGRGADGPAVGGRGGAVSPTRAETAGGCPGVAVALRSVVVRVPGEGPPVLDGASLCIAPGETVVLLGANGAGKSTIAALLLGFLAPDDGAVTVGGNDLGGIDLDRWRELVTYQPSHPSLLAGTLAENLRLARRDATDDELLVALEGAAAGDLVAGLALGLETPLGEGGRPTSAGERQRIAVARTLLRPASLYVLDEPTVHLDDHSESVVLASLARALAGRSALVVTHRPAAVALADRVVTLAGERLHAGCSIVPQAPAGPARTGAVVWGNEPVLHYLEAGAPA